jgi:hypothetical protein
MIKNTAYVDVNPVLDIGARVVSVSLAIICLRQFIPQDLVVVFYAAMVFGLMTKGLHLFVIRSNTYWYEKLRPLSLLIEVSSLGITVALTGGLSSGLALLFFLTPLGLGQWTHTPWFGAFVVHLNCLIIGSHCFAVWHQHGHN